MLPKDEKDFRLPNSAYIYFGRASGKTMLSYKQIKELEKYIGAKIEIHDDWKSAVSKMVVSKTVEKLILYGSEINDKSIVCGLSNAELKSATIRSLDILSPIYKFMDYEQEPVSRWPKCNKYLQELED